MQVVNIHQFVAQSQLAGGSPVPGSGAAGGTERLGWSCGLGQRTERPSLLEEAKEHIQLGCPLSIMHNGVFTLSCLGTVTGGAQANGACRGGPGRGVKRPWWLRS